MKKLFLGAALAMMSLSAMAQEGTFQVKGNVGALPDSLVAMVGRKRDTVLVKKNKFDYVKKVDTPTWIYMGSLEELKKGYFRGARIFAIPGESVQLKGKSLNDASLVGGKFYQEQEKMDDFVSKARADLDSLQSWYYKNVNDANRDSLTKIADEREEPLQKKYAADLLAYAKQNPGQECTALLIDELDKLSDKQSLVDLLADNVKNGRLKPYYEAILDRAKKRAEMEEKAKKVQASGVEAPNFTLKDIKGNDFQLSSLRGKYVILDFWGSWCIWCIKGMPKMKEYYSKYAGKFEIVGVDCNDTEAKWKAAVEKHQLPWIHVYNPKGSNVLDQYAIQGFPTKIVVGPDGKIVKTIVGEDPAFYTLLDELFSK